MGGNLGVYKFKGLGVYKFKGLHQKYICKKYSKKNHIKINCFLLQE